MDYLVGLLEFTIGFLVDLVSGAVLEALKGIVGIGV